MLFEYTLFPRQLLYFIEQLHEINRLILLRSTFDCPLYHLSLESGGRIIFTDYVTLVVYRCVDQRDDGVCDSASIQVMSRYKDPDPDMRALLLPAIASYLCVDVQQITPVTYEGWSRKDIWTWEQNNANLEGYLTYKIKFFT